MEFVAGWLASLLAAYLVGRQAGYNVGFIRGSSYMYERCKAAPSVLIDDIRKEMKVPRKRIGEIDKC